MFDMKCKIHKHTNIKTGLTKEEVLKSKPNVYIDQNTRTVGQIIKENSITLFNGINVVLAIMVALTGSFRNMLFIGLVVINTVIGIIQELRSKKVLDNLALLNQQKAKVLRDGKVVQLPVEQIVKNDILYLSSGDQVCVDAVCVDGSVECNESIGDTLMSGSFVVSGKAKVQVVQVGKDTYSHAILESAKREKQYPSELRDSIDAIIRFCTIVLIPTGATLFIKQMMDSGRLSPFNQYGSGFRCGKISP